MEGGLQWHCGGIRGLVIDQFKSHTSVRTQVLSIHKGTSHAGTHLYSNCQGSRHRQLWGMLISPTHQMEELQANGRCCLHKARWIVVPRSKPDLWLLCIYTDVAQTCPQNKRPRTEISWILQGVRRGTGWN